MACGLVQVIGLLNQAPRYELAGRFIEGLCEDEAWAEGSLVIQILQNCLELLGFQRSHLAEYVPKGLRPDS